MGQFVKVASKADIPAGTGKVVEAGGKTLAVFNCDGAFYAIDNTCLHRGGPLGQGVLEGECVTCPWHGWQYNVTTGEAVFNEQIKVQTYEVQVEGDDICVGL